MKDSKKKFDFSNIVPNKDFRSTVSILLMMLAVIVYLAVPSNVHAIALTAMFFSCIGDFILMDYRGMASYYLKEKRFYFGMAVFAIAHVLYAWAFASQLAKITFGAVEFCSFMILVASIVFMQRLGLTKSIQFSVVSALYAAVIFIHAVAALNCAIEFGGKYIVAFAGVVCFIVSDVFILVRETKKKTPFIQKMIWVFYPIAQVLILTCI